MRNRADANPAIPHRQHPLAMLQYTYKYLYLLLVPLLRGLWHIHSPEGLYRWMRGTWIDILAVLLLLGLPFASWWCNIYSLTDDAFVLYRGIFLRRTSYIPRHHITTLSVAQPLLLRPLNIVRLFIDTDAGNKRHTDFRLLINSRQAASILEQQPPDAHLPKHIHRPRLYRLLLLSVLSSNSLSGILLLAITFHQAGVLLGQEFQSQVLNNLQNATAYVTIIPRTAAAVAFLLVVGWCMAALRNLLQHAPFRVIRCEHTLTIRTGFLTRREYACVARGINYIDMRQTLAGRLLHVYTAFIHCVGYGKAKNTLSVLIPYCRARTCQQELAGLVPEHKIQPAHQRPAPFSLFRYCRLPLCLALLLCPLALRASLWFPNWREIIYYLIGMAYIPCLWLLAVRIVDRYTAGLSRGETGYTIRYSRLFTLHTVSIPNDKLVTWRLQQSPFQKRIGTCTVLLYTYNESRQPHRLRNFRYADVLALLENTPI